MSLMYHDTVIAGTPVIDNTPTAGSNHAVSSGGVKSALDNKVDNSALDVVDRTSALTLTSAVHQGNFQGSVVKTGKTAIITINCGISQNTITANTWVKIVDLPNDMIPPRVVAGVGILCDSSGNPIGPVRFSITKNDTAINFKYESNYSTVSNIYANFTYGLA